MSHIYIYHTLVKKAQGRKKEGYYKRNLRQSLTFLHPSLQPSWHQ